VFLVSHDRTLSRQRGHQHHRIRGASGRWREFEGGVTDWLTQSKRASAIAQARGRKGPRAVPLRSRPGSAGTAAQAVAPRVDRASACCSACRGARNCGFKEQRELDQLPDITLTLLRWRPSRHVLRRHWQTEVCLPEDDAQALALSARSAEIDDALLVALERWEAFGRRL